MEGLGILYRSRNHEFYNSWLGMLNPETKAEPQAFLLVSCYIIGPNDNPPVHGINEIVYFEDDPDAVLALAYLPSHLTWKKESS